MIAFVKKEGACDPEEMIQDYYRDAQPPLRLDAVIKHEGGVRGTYGDRIAHGGLNPEDALERARMVQSAENLRQKVLEEVQRLPDRLSDILVKGGGLMDGRPRSVKALADDFVVSRQRIEQLRTRAKRRLADQLCAKGIVSRPCSLEQVSDILEAVGAFVRETPKKEIDPSVCVGYCMRGRPAKRRFCVAA